MRYLTGKRKATIKHHLKYGGIIAYPTESCFGLGCLPYHSRALKRIIRLKKRPVNKGLIVIGNDISQFKRLTVKLNCQEKQSLQQQWQQADATTYLLPTHRQVLPILRGKGRQLIALRLPKHDGARAVCRQLNTALVSTSANRSHQKPCRSTREAQKIFGKHTLVIQGLIGKQRKPSTIIDWQSKKIIRN